MGGCYTDYSDSSCKSSYSSSLSSLLRKFAKDHDNAKLIKAHRVYFQENEKGGFFAKLAEACGIEDVKDIPNEAPEIEYEVKFDVQPIKGKGNEPNIADYLNAFDFPAVNGARFIKDPVNNIATGVNNFYGDANDERLVVIEKCGGLYLKEKGLVVSLNTGVDLEQMVIKRTEERYPTTHSESVEKINEICLEDGVCYRGKIRKEKGDAFILDTNDGRIYSMSFTRAHLMKFGETEESGTQRQLEMEYAGFMPGFAGFKEGEDQIVQGMVDLGKYTAVMYGKVPIANGWKAKVVLTGERKYDFITGTGRKELPLMNQRLLVNQFPI